MKTILSLSLFVAAVTLLAANMDSRFESAVRGSNVFKTYIKNGNIDLQSNAVVVTLTGNVSEKAHQSRTGVTEHASHREPRGGRP